MSLGDIRITGLCPRRRQHGVDLPAMMGLVVEQLHHQQPLGLGSHCSAIQAFQDTQNSLNDILPCSRANRS